MILHTRSKSAFRCFFYSYLLDWDGNEVNKGHFVDSALGAMWSGQYNRMLSIS